MTHTDGQPKDSSEQVNVTKIGAFITERREALGISQRELIRRSGVINLNRLELGTTASPRTDTLQAVADALGISLSELVAAGRPEELPTLTPYLRAKYGDMPEEGRRRMTKYFERLAKEYNMSDGPRDGEDERDE